MNRLLQSSIESHSRIARTGVVFTFVILPFLSAIIALRSYNEQWSKNIFWLFVIFFGYTFVITGYMDSTRYSQRLSELSSHNLSTSQDLLPLLYQKDSNYVDLLEPLVTFMVSRFTDNSRILFAVFGLIFGFFYSRNLWFLFSKVEGNLKREAIPFLILAAMVIAIWQINGFRFWTAAHVFIYGLIHAHSGSKFKGLLFATLSCLVHFTFVFAIILMWIHVLVGNRLVVISILYFLSFFLVEIEPEVVRDYASVVPEIFQERTEGYTNEEYRHSIEKTYEGANWYVTLRHTSIRYSINIILLFLLLRRRQLIISNKEALSLLCFALLLAIGVNLFRGIPSMYRYQYVSDVILFSALFLFTQAFRKPVFPLVVRLPFICAAILYVIVEIRIGFETTSLVTILGNPLVAPFVPNDLALISFFK